jgi:hypothetical protein
MDGEDENNALSSRISGKYGQPFEGPFPVRLANFRRVKGLAEKMDGTVVILPVPPSEDFVQGPSGDPPLASGHEEAQLFRKFNFFIDKIDVWDIDTPCNRYS